MERHTQRMNRVRVYAHIHFDQIPSTDINGPHPHVISIDSLSDQTPLMELRDIPDFVPFFRGITWSTSPEPCGDVGLSVRKVIAWPQNIHLALGEYSGLKQLSLVCRKDTIDRNLFYTHYQRHIDIARKHHGMEKYAQNIDLEYLYGPQSKSSRIDGISELWFKSESDWSQRFYLNDKSQEVIREDTQRFINFESTSSIMVSEKRFRRTEK